MENKKFFNETQLSNLEVVTFLIYHTYMRKCIKVHKE